MFEITDEFLVEAGFRTLEGDDKERLRQQATDMVEQKVGEYIAEAVGEDRSDELEQLISGDNAELVGKVLSRIDPDYKDSPDFHEIEQLGRSNSASDAEIEQQFAVLAWFREQQIDIASIVQNSMNEVMVELKGLRDAVGGMGQ